ncbi:MAG: hypothetical protein KAS15_01335 [Nanoarchaeota archaeon]|nr:hypothetical protein [Nanoarchaeota archaeon]
MHSYTTIGYEGCGRCPIPIQVRNESVSSDKTVVIPRIQKIFDLFSGRIPEEKRDGFLEKLIQNTVLVDGRDQGAQRLLNGRYGMYSRLNGRVYIDTNHRHCPSLVEHELIHLLGETYIWKLPFPRRVINQHSIAANIATTLFDEENLLKYHQLGEANNADFHKIRLYRLVPNELQEMIPDFRRTCERIGNYTRENGTGDEILYRFSK